MVSVILRGGLGNNLYMIGAAFGHAKRNGFDYEIPLEIDNPHYAGQKPYIFPGITYCEKLPNLPLYKEPHYHYSPIPATDNIILDGYFQSFRYIDDFRDEYLKALGFKWEPKPEHIALHYRAGDYRKLPDHHPLVSDEYIHNSVSHFIKKGFKKFIVFSTEIDTIEGILEGNGYGDEIEFEYSEGRTEMEDLQYGSCCAGQILSNGTFSLWMYWLNQNRDKECTAPSRWFGKLLPHDTKDLIPQEAITIYAAL